MVNGTAFCGFRSGSSGREAAEKKTDMEEVAVRCGAGAPQG